MGGFAGSRLVEALRSGLMLAIRQYFGAVPVVLLFLLPLLFSFLLLLPGLFDAQSFAALFQHPQFWGAVRLTLLTGVTSTTLALGLAIVIVMGAGHRLLSQSAVFLALPHLALAMGLGFLLAPTGLLARIFVGGATPPDWQLVQDPWGFGLTMALVLKETPFLVWAMAQVIQGDELRLRFQQESVLARSLGHGPVSTFLKIILPQVLPRVVWPLVAVLSYGLTVVDMALVIGPAQPPTLAQLLWTDLNDGESLINARGAAGTLVLSGGILLLVLLLWVALKATRPILRRLLTAPARAEWNFKLMSRAMWWLWPVVYAAVIFALALQSFSLHWPYPDLLANSFSARAWINIGQNAKPFFTSLALGLLTSTFSVLAIVVWLETLPQRFDRLAMFAATLMLCVPALLVSLGQYRLLLQLGWIGTGFGLFSAHLLPVMAYVFVMLQGPYRGYDQRWLSVGQGLGVARFKFLMQVKWPMLRGAITSAGAIGFAVSIVQFVPAQLAAAGRFSTLPMEAVTLSSGGNRALISAYALVLMLLPLLGFIGAAWFSKSRWPDA
jgi:putative thiamine transport system permease protein